MRLSSLFFFLTTLVLLAFGAYFYVERWRPLVQAVEDLQEDNLLLARKLRELRPSEKPMEVALPESTRRVLEEEREAVLPQRFAFQINQIFRRNSPRLASGADRALKELLVGLKDTSLSRVEVWIPAYRRGNDPGYDLAARRAATLGEKLLSAGLDREDLLLAFSSSSKDSLEIRLFREGTHESGF